jgi:predicted ferric reductase
VGYLGFFQRHSFFATRTPDSSKADGVADSIELRVQLRGGFTKRLEMMKTSKKAIIEGPYGSRADFSEFGTVVLFASGIGVVGHLLYIKELIKEKNHYSSKTRDVILI